MTPCALPSLRAEDQQVQGHPDAGFSKPTRVVRRIGSERQVSGESNVRRGTWKGLFAYLLVNRHVYVPAVVFAADPLLAAGSGSATAVSDRLVIAAAV